MKTTTRSISFDQGRFDLMEKELKSTGMGRSEFIDYLLMQYFESPELKQRAKLIKRS